MDNSTHESITSSFDGMDLNRLQRSGLLDDLLRRKEAREKFPFHDSAFMGDIQHIKTELLKLPEADRMSMVNARDDEGKTPLYKALEACEENGGKALEIVQFLCEHGADPNIRDNNDCSPLYHAVKHGSFTTISTKSYVPVISWLLKNTLVDVNALNGVDQESALAAALKGFNQSDERIITLLLAHHADCAIGGISVLEKTIDAAFGTSNNEKYEHAESIMRLMLADSEIDPDKVNTDEHTLFDEMLVGYISALYETALMEGAPLTPSLRNPQKVIEVLVLSGAALNQSKFYCDADHDNECGIQLECITAVFISRFVTRQGAGFTDSARAELMARVEAVQRDDIFVQSMQTLRKAIAAALEAKKAIDKQIEGAGLKTLHSPQIIRQFSLGSDAERSKLLEEKAYIEKCLTKAGVSFERPKITAQLLLSSPKQKSDFLNCLRALNPTNPELFTLSKANEMVCAVLKESISGSKKHFLFRNEALQKEKYLADQKETHRLTFGM